MPDRRNEIELNSAEVAEFIQQTQTIIVVTNGPDGFPHPMPMWFYADSSHVCYCTTFRKSQKVVNLRRDRRATLLLETGQDYSKLKGLVIKSTAEIIDSYDVVVDTMRAIRQRKPPLGFTESLEATLIRSAPKRVVLKFVPNIFISWDHRKLGNIS
ncbi:MAG: pyridoxamine 5'-phosphate oxidase [Gammaproteobacteria bacterium]|nr:pyridoxamine 5'-phosphate oxidase [Gammaproteobacteria bacterium]MYF37568.1 pyridoxamine 5'-phosphate oxidase [Gammaproteobacteria bacterium]